MCGYADVVMKQPGGNLMISKFGDLVMKQPTDELRYVIALKVRNRLRKVWPVNLPQSFLHQTFPPEHYIARQPIFGLAHVPTAHDASLM